MSSCLFSCFWADAQILLTRRWRWRETDWERPTTSLSTCSSSLGKVTKSTCTANWSCASSRANPVLRWVGWRKSSFTEVKIEIQQCENTPLQVKVLLKYTTDVSSANCTQSKKSKSTHDAAWFPAWCYIHIYYWIMITIASICEQHCCSSLVVQLILVLYKVLHSLTCKTRQCYKTISVLKSWFCSVLRIRQPFCI